MSELVGCDCVSSCCYSDWLVEQGLTSHQTHYRSYRGRVFMGKVTQPTVSKHWRKSRHSTWNRRLSCDFWNSAVHVGSRFRRQRLEDGN